MVDQMQMNRLRRRVSPGRLTVWGLAIALTLGVGLAGAGHAADTIYVNGDIYTGDESNPSASAMVIDGDRFVYVGSDEIARSWATAETNVIDLQGAFVAPGFYDLHVHPDLLFEPDLTNQIQTQPLGPDELKSAILEFADANPGDGWIFGGTWDFTAFGEKGVEPGAAYLDGFMPDRPVIILDTGRHVMIANSLAMEMAGVDRNTYPPDHGTIFFDDAGDPVGRFADGAQSLFSDVLPLGNWQTFREAYSLGQDLLNEYGIVAARSQHVNTDRLQGVQALDRAGELTVRYEMAISWKNDLFFTVPDRAALLSGERHRYRSRHVNANYFKMHLDGTVSSQTGFFFDPYPNSNGNLGRLNETPEELTAVLRQLDREGISVQIHVVGDQAARVALDAIEATRKANGPDGPRHAILHAYFLHPDDLNRIAELNIAAEFTYNLVNPEMDEVMSFVYKVMLNAVAEERMLSVKPVLDSGGRAVFGSDLVVSRTPNPFPAIARLMQRDHPTGVITAEDALRMLTINGAWAMSMEEDAGSITAGKLADLVVLDRDWFEIPASDVADTQVLRTVFEGQTVYEKP